VIPFATFWIILLTNINPLRVSLVSDIVLSKTPKDSGATIAMFWNRKEIDKRLKGQMKSEKKCTETKIDQSKTKQKGFSQTRTNVS
jgi:hypothetical protein